MLITDDFTEAWRAFCMTAEYLVRHDWFLRHTNPPPPPHHDERTLELFAANVMDWMESASITARLCVSMKNVTKIISVAPSYNC